MVMSIFQEKEFIFIGHKKHVLKTLSLVTKKDKIRLILDKSENAKECFLFTLKKWLFIKNSYKIHLTYPIPYSKLFFLFFLLKIDIVFMHSYWRRWTQNKQKIFHWVTLKMLCRLQRGIKIIVLGNWIYKNIQNDIFLNIIEKEKINWINHPGQKVRNIKCQNNANQINFGFIWDQKQPYKFIDPVCLEKIQTTITDLWHNVIIDSRNFIEESDYIKNITESHYIVVLSAGNAYDYACSGIFIDAIFHQKPIICLKWTMSDYFFEKYGDIGFQFNNIQELNKGIKKIHQEHSLTYKKRTKNLKKALKEFNTKSIQGQLKKIMLTK